MADELSSHSFHVVAPREKTRILYYSEGWGLGGIERFVMNTTKLLDPTRYAFDVFCTHDWDTSHDDAIHQLGGKRFVVFEGHKPNLAKRLVASLRAWRGLLATGDYGAVHINTMNGVGFTYAREAERANVPIRIVHSHNTDYGSGHRRVKELAHSYCKNRYLRCATKLLATSQEAGHYLFGQHHFEILHTTVDTDVFHFVSDARQRIRTELGIAPNDLLFGGVGRLAPEKNYRTQIDVLRTLLDAGLHVHLLIVGSGPEEAALRAYAQELDVTHRLHMPGATSNPPDYLSALDVVTVPSLYEGGAPLAVTEALCCGCPCVIAQGVDSRNLQTPFVRYEDPSNTSQWAQTVCELASLATEREVNNEALAFVRSIGFDNESNRQTINRLYAG